MCQVKNVKDVVTITTNPKITVWTVSSTFKYSRQQQPLLCWPHPQLKQQSGSIRPHGRKWITKNTRAHRSWYLQPLVNTSCVELVLARECTKQLSRLKVSKTHNARRLKWYRAWQTATAFEWWCPTQLGVETIAWQTIDVRSRQTTWLCIAKTLGQIQQCLQPNMSNQRWNVEKQRFNINLSLQIVHSETVSLVL